MSFAAAHSSVLPGAALRNTADRNKINAAALVRREAPVAGAPHATSIRRRCLLPKAEEGPSQDAQAPSSSSPQPSALSPRRRVRGVISPQHARPHGSFAGTPLSISTVDRDGSGARCTVRRTRAIGL